MGNDGKAWHDLVESLCFIGGWNKEDEEEMYISLAGSKVFYLLNLDLIQQFTGVLSK